MGRWGDAFRAYTNTCDTVDTADTNGSVQSPDGGSVNSVSSVTLAGNGEAALPGEVSLLSAVSASGVISPNRASPAQALVEQCITPGRDTVDTADTIAFGRVASDSVSTVTCFTLPAKASGWPPSLAQVSTVSAVSRPGGITPPGGRPTRRAPGTSAEDRAVLEANARIALAHATARQDADGISRVYAWFQRYNTTP